MTIIIQQIIHRAVQGCLASGTALGRIAVIAAIGTGTGLAGDWAQYRGPNFDGTTSESVSAAWPAAGAPVLWKRSMNAGFSSFIVSNQRAFTLVSREFDGQLRETCLAVDAATGQELWARPFGEADYDGGGDSGARNNRGGDGARSTPAADGERVYVLTSRMELACLDAATGEPVWSRDLVETNGAQVIHWQNAASPVIDGDFIFVCGGGEGQSLMAIRKQNGAVVWKGESDEMTHSTPAVGTIHGVRQVIFFTRSGLVSARTEDGEILWRYAFPFRTSSAITPVIGGDIVYCSAGYGVGGGAVRVSPQGAGTRDKFEAKELWRSRGNKYTANHWSTPVYRDGHLYGLFSFKEYGDGPLKCVELASGTVKWEQPGFGPGNCVLAGDTLVVLGDDGQLITADADPAGYRERSRMKLLDGKCWSMPAVASGRVYVRSTVEGACVDLRL